ncbi:MAG TPA: hypothetical protein PLQ41_05705 [bacterium]|nr:hypothetical protein [bacterium]HPP29776.1 hypothetical protein [bacterium]
MKVWVKKSRNFSEANRFDIEYYLHMTPEQRLETVQMLREMKFRLKGDENRKRLRRVVKIIKQK